MDWNQLICSTRLGLEEYRAPRQTRNDFERDYDRLVFSSPFRRLQNKTQVFPLPGSIFVHNRLTHSLEVSSVGRSLAREVVNGLRERHGDRPCFEAWSDIVSAACLCHDIGNPPFGHSGEKTIGSYFAETPGLEEHLRPQLTDQQWLDLVRFEGNANSFRLLTHQFEGRRPGGFAMTYSALAAIVKYPHSSLLAGEKGKFGFFASEQPIYERVAARLGIGRHPDGSYMRHPLVYIVEAADDICYQIMDMEDAHKLHVLDTATVKHTLGLLFDEDKRERTLAKLSRVSDPNEQIAFMRSVAVGELVQEAAAEFLRAEDEILAGTYRGSLIGNLRSQAGVGYRACSALAYARIYHAPDVLDVEIAGNRIMTNLLDHLLQAVLHPDRVASRLLLAKVPEQYNVHAPDVYGKVQSVLDHLSAMTDVYALDLYRKLNGHSLPAV
ncbi:MAG: dGTP triphosphohydrolase [Lepagella sp.]